MSYSGQDQHNKPVIAKDTLGNERDFAIEKRACYVWCNNSVRPLRGTRIQTSAAPLALITPPCTDMVALPRGPYRFLATVEYLRWVSWDLGGFLLIIIPSVAQKIKLSIETPSARDYSNHHVIVLLNAVVARLQFEFINN
jgi:hypothetical protein